MTSSSKHYYLFQDTKALKASHPEVQKLKRQGSYPSAHGNKVWRSSFVLMDYFLSNPIPQNSKVIDAGCGWGLSGVFLAKAFQAQVIGYDIDEHVAPFLALQASINDCQIRFQKKSFEKITKQDMAGCYTLIGADICFWDELTPVIFNMIRRALQAGVQRIVIADPGRPPFWELADWCTEKLEAEVVIRTIYKPIKTTKHLLVVGELPE